MARRKISVEDFTKDVLSGMTDDDLMKKYHISRRHLEAMFAKLLQRGEIKPGDLADATQKIQEPTLELAATCPHCGALNLLGTGQCPECGMSRMTRHFKALDTQETQALDVQASNLPGQKSVSPIPSEDEFVLPRDESKAAEPEKVAKPAPRKARRLAAWAAVLVMGLVALAAVGVYTDLISLPFLESSIPPLAVQKPSAPATRTGVASRADPVRPPAPPQQKVEPAEKPSAPSVPPPVAKREPPLTAAETVMPPKLQVKPPDEPVPVQQATKPPAREQPADESPPRSAKVRPPVELPEQLSTEVPRPAPQHEKQSEPTKEEAADPTAVDLTTQKTEGKSAEIPQLQERRDENRQTEVSSQGGPSARPALERPVREETSTPVKHGIDGTPEPPATSQPRDYRRAALDRTFPPLKEERTSGRRQEMGPGLITAVRAKDAAQVKQLLDGGADPDVMDDRGATALMYAARGRCTVCVKTLLEHGADVSIRDSAGDTALDMARRAGRVGAAALIIAHDPQRGPAALVVASREGLTALVQLLVENGVDVNAADENGNTALMAASENGNVDVVAVLLNNRADVRARNNHGQTALAVALGSHVKTSRIPSRTRRELVRMLEQHTQSEADPTRPRR